MTMHHQQTVTVVAVAVVVVVVVEMVVVEMVEEGMVVGFVGTVGCCQAQPALGL
jgi:hypothetical protein